MKPARIKAERDRRANVEMRKWARRIPDNAKLINIMARCEGPLRRDLYQKLRPYLRFSPIPLEELNALIGAS